MNKNYLRIVLHGYLDINTNEHLADYLGREYETAKKEGFGRDEFFKGCKRITESFMNDLEYQFGERKQELYLLIGAAKDKKLGYDKDDTSHTNEERLTETVRQCEQELESISINNYYVKLDEYTNGAIKHCLSYGEVLIIDKAIRESIIRSLRKNDNETTIPSENKKPSYPTIALFCRLLKESKIIERNEYTQGIGEYCEMVCKRFNLKYAINVSSSYSNKPTSKYINKVKESVFPLIEDKIIVEKLNKYLDSLELNKEKMFG